MEACPIKVLLFLRTIERLMVAAVDFIEKPYNAEAMLGAVRFALSGGEQLTRAMREGSKRKRSWQVYSPMSGGFWRPSSMGAPISRSRLTSA